jgi:hypothetical protein
VPTTPNGWPTSPNPATFGGLDNREVPGAPGVHLAPGIRAGDPADILFHFAAQFHEHVEPLVAGTCWGFAFRPNTNNKKVISEHGGAAADLNAPQHPNGKRGTFTPEQVGIIRALLATYDDLIVWGGDFQGTDDEMHFELRHDPAKLATLAAEIRAGAQPEPAPAHADDVAWTGHDLTGSGNSLRGEEGDEGPRVKELQHDLNQYAPAYSHLAEDGEWGHQTSAVLDEYAERNAHEHDTPAADRAGLHDSDGRNIGPRLARALNHDGLI